MGLLDVLGRVGNVLDLPGSSLRDALMGEDPWDQWGSMTTGENRSTGRDLLRAIGLAGEEDTTANAIGGMLAEMLIDPTNLIGGALLGGKAFQRAGAKKVNALRKLELEPRVFRPRPKSGEVPEGYLTPPLDLESSIEYALSPRLQKDPGLSRDMLYHVSPHGEDIVESGMLYGSGRWNELGEEASIRLNYSDPHSGAPRGPTGLGSYDEGVSLTLDPAAASDMERWFQGLGEIAVAGREGGSGLPLWQALRGAVDKAVRRDADLLRSRIPDEWFSGKPFDLYPRAGSKQATGEEMWRGWEKGWFEHPKSPKEMFENFSQAEKAYGEEMLAHLPSDHPSAIKGWAKIKKAQSAKATKQMLSEYVSRLHDISMSSGLAKQPFSVGFGSPMHMNLDALLDLSPESVRKFGIPVERIPKKTFLKPGSDMGELLVMGDIPLEGATVYGGPGGAYEFSPYQRVPRMSPLIKALLAERLINKGLNQFQVEEDYEDPLY